jgi:predicted nucleic acid-binding protein
VRPNPILIDSSFLIALYNVRDQSYQAARQFFLVNSANLLVPDVTLVEASYLVERERGTPAVIRLLEAFEGEYYTLECLTKADLARVNQIKKDYPKANFDFVDCCLMALAERLNITQICTFDRRDFSIFRPRHADYLELLP